MVNKISSEKVNGRNFSKVDPLETLHDLYNVEDGFSNVGREIVKIL